MDWDRDEYIRANTNAATITAIEKYAKAHEEISLMLPKWEAMTDQELATEHARILAPYEAAYVTSATQGLNSHEQYADWQLWRLPQTSTSRSPWTDPAVFTLCKSGRQKLRWQ